MIEGMGNGHINGPAVRRLCRHGLRVRLTPWPHPSAPPDPSTGVALWELTLASHLLEAG